MKLAEWCEDASYLREARYVAEDDTWQDLVYATGLGYLEGKSWQYWDGVSDTFSGLRRTSYILYSCQIMASYLELV